MELNAPLLQAHQLHHPFIITNITTSITKTIDIWRLKDLTVLWAYLWHLLTQLIPATLTLSLL